MDVGAEQKIIGMLDVLANGLVEFRSEFDGFRAEFNDFRTEMYEFRAETSENFNRHDEGVGPKGQQLHTPEADA